MTEIDLTGWYAVDNDMGDETAIYVVEGRTDVGGTSQLLLRDIATSVCFIGHYLSSYSWFRPTDLELAKARQAEEIAAAVSDELDAVEEAA